MKQTIITLDMEGVLTPEIWIAVAEKTGIAELRRTTRDEPDYDQLMQYRIETGGDSYNDTAMLGEADQGFLIHAPEKVKSEFPQFPAVDSHAELVQLIKSALAERL